MNRAEWNERIIMTVWTHVSLEELNEWLEKRGFCLAKTLSPIEDGVEDSVFKVDHVDGSITCLRLFERTEAKGPLSIATHLDECGLLCCPPLLGKRKNRALVNLCGKPAAIFPWIEGSWIEKPSLDQIKEIGAFLGQMGFACEKYCSDWHRKNPRGWDWFEQATEKLSPVLPQDEYKKINAELKTQLAFWKSEEAKKIPHGPVHADMFRNNVMFKENGSLGAVIDWGFCASDTPLIYDLAIVANDWCLEDGGYELDKTRLDTLLEGRNSIQPLTKEEIAAWPMALRWAGLRFYLSRAIDLHFPRDPNGKAHDPKPFLRIMEARQKL